MSEKVPKNANHLNEAAASRLVVEMSELFTGLRLTIMKAITPVSFSDSVTINPPQGLCRIPKEKHICLDLFFYLV